MAVGHDITERKAAENLLHGTVDTLSRANAELERFAHITAHDLQEPVRTVVSFSQMLQRHLGDGLDNSGREFLDYIVRGARRMGELVRDLRSYTQISNRKSTRSVVDLNAVIKTVFDNLRGLIDERAAHFEITPLPVFVGDSVLLTELFQNLIDNAIKFTPVSRRPEIKVSACREGNFFILSVSDHGIGISQRYQKRIFDMFQRLNTGGAYPGTGIGLAICKRIVEQHGGRIWIESEEGQGATFNFTLSATDPGTIDQGSTDQKSE